MKSNTYIGAHHLERVEDERFLRGLGQYVDDLTAKDIWHAVVLRSSVGHGRVVSVDVSMALAIPGVHAVITAADIVGEIPTIPFRRPNPTVGPYAQPVIARNKVRYFGEPLALVLADSAAVAEDALAHIEVSIVQLPAVLTRDEALSGTTLLFEETTEGNLASVFTATKGHADAAFDQAHLVVSGHFSTQRQTAMPLETRGLLAEWDDNNRRLRVFGAAKLPFFNRKTMAEMIKLPETSIEYIEVDVGGGFGARGEFYPEDYLVAFAAIKYGHPVKWVEDRREHFTAIAHSREAEAAMELALDEKGQILGLRGEIFCNVGAYVRPNGMTPVRNAAQASGPYRIPNVHLLAHAYLSNKTPSGTYRGPGRYEGCFFIERLMDMAAKKLNIDRVEIRRMNVLTQSEMPYPLASVLPSEGAADASCDSGEYVEALDRCVSEFKWQEKIQLNGKRVGNRYHGVAVGCFIEGGASGPSETARMLVESDGSVSVFVGSSAIGQGLETIMSQIAADALEISIDRIRVFHGSTTYLKEGWGSYASRATVMGGSAVMDAAKKLLVRFQIVAAARLGVACSDVVVADGIAKTADGRSVTLAEMAKAAIESEGRFDNSKPTYTYGAAAAHVAVDPETGHVDVLEYIVCDDVGRIINPLTLHGQVMGAAVQGMGSVFSESLVYDEGGTLLVGTLVDYVMPLATDYPHIHCISLESYPSPNNPLGAKGAGEGGIIPVGGVIANAVTSALEEFGARADHLPLSPSCIWEMINPATV